MCSRILISTSLFFNNHNSNKYNRLYKNIINSIEILKEYIVDIVIYHDNSVPKIIIDDLKKCKNVFLIEKPKSNNRDGCFWRYEAYDDFDYDIYFFRDIDISLEKNDIFIIDKFINSSKNIFYTFIVHPRKPYPKQGFLMGGMFGMKKCISSFKEIIVEYKLNNKLGYYGSDEEFLAKHLYKLESPLVFIEPRIKNKNVILNNVIFNNLKLQNDYEEYLFFKNDYELKDL